MLAQRADNATNIDGITVIDAKAKAQHYNLAEGLTKDAEKCVSRNNLYAAAHCYKGAAVFYALAGMSNDSKMSWARAAEMFDTSINTRFGYKGHEGTLSPEDWKNIQRRSKEALEASTNADGMSDLKNKHAAISKEVGELLEDRIMPDWQKLMMRNSY